MAVRAFSKSSMFWRKYVRNAGAHAHDFVIGEAGCHKCGGASYAEEVCADARGIQSEVGAHLIEVCR